MNKQLGSLLLVGGLIGAGYFAFNKIVSEDLSLKMVRKITQEIKHQILIVTISFAEGCKEHYGKLHKTSPVKQAELAQYFRNKLSEIYSQKEDLILAKYGLTKENYGDSLRKYAKDDKLIKMQKQIFDMMERAVLGEYPDLTVDARIKAIFGKPEMKKIYQDMSKMILFALLTKLQQQKTKDRYFDSSSDDQFRRVIRELGIYDKKIQFFKQKGFKQEWGCPNQSFFKHSESLKIQDPQFKAEMRRLQAIYQRVVDIAAKDPFSMSIEKINQYYIEKSVELIEQVQEPEEQQYMNLQASTKSEPENQPEQSAPAQKIEQVPEVVPEVIPEVVPEVEINKQQTSEKVSEPEPAIKYEDVPSDAHELQKQLHENQLQADQKQEPEVEGEIEPEIANSNISLDAVQLETEPLNAEPEVQNKEIVEQPKINTQNHENQQSKEQAQVEIVAEVAAEVVAEVAAEVGVEPESH